MENFISIDSHANDEHWHIRTYFAVGGLFVLCLTQTRTSSIQPKTVFLLQCCFDAQDTYLIIHYMVTFKTLIMLRFENGIFRHTNENDVVTATLRANP